MAANRIRSMFPTPARKGETFELRNGLNSQYSHERFGSPTGLKRCKLPRGTLGFPESCRFHGTLQSFAGFMGFQTLSSSASSALTWRQKGSYPFHHRFHDAGKRCVGAVSGYYQEHGMRSSLTYTDSTFFRCEWS
jgi:hypothetical protein